MGGRGGSPVMGRGGASLPGRGTTSMGGRGSTAMSGRGSPSMGGGQGVMFDNQSTFGGFDELSSSGYCYDQDSNWDHSRPKVESIRDAGVKVRPNSVLGSIASSS